MGVEYSVHWEPGVRLEQRAMRLAFRGIIMLVLIAAIPLALGLLQQVAFVHASASKVTGGKNAAATASTLGNQLPNPALENRVNAVSATQGGILALCSGLASARTGTRPNCTLQASTIQR